MRDKESKSGVWSYGDRPRETLIFQDICGCSPIASMGKVVKGDKLGRGVAGKITNVTRHRDISCMGNLAWW